MALNRRDMLRMTAPAVAMPLVSVSGAVEAAARPDLVTKEELMEAFRIYDGMAMTSDAFNDRFALMFDLLFESDPAILRKRLDKIRKDREDGDFLDLETGRVRKFKDAMAERAKR